MDKMYLVPQDEYESFRGKDSSKEASDIKVAKLQDAFIRKRDEKEVRENKNWEQLSSRLKPIMSAHQAELQKIVKDFPEAQQDQAQFLLTLLSRLPKVTISSNRLLIDGQPMTDGIIAIVEDMIDNGIHGVESLISFLRRERDYGEMTFHSTASTPRQKKSASMLSSKSSVFMSPKASSSPLKISPMKLSPIKTRGQRLREGTKTVSPRDLTRKKNKSAVILKEGLPPKKDDRGSHYWLSW